MLAMCLTVSQEKRSETAGTMLRRAVTTYEKFKGKDDPLVAIVLHDLFVWYVTGKDYDDAEKALTRAIAIHEKAFGPETTKLATFLDNMGDLHGVQISDFDPDAIQAEINGTPHPESQSEKHGKQAEVFYRRALAIREKTLKPDDPDIADTLYNLGQLATRRKRPADVEQFFTRWLALHEKAMLPRAIG